MKGLWTILRLIFEGFTGSRLDGVESPTEPSSNPVSEPDDTTLPPVAGDDAPTRTPEASGGLPESGGVDTSPKKPEAPAIIPPPSLDFGLATPVARAVLAKGFEVFDDNSKPYNLNIVGVRDASPEFDRFGCRLVQFWKEESGEWHVISVPFTTYPGAYYTQTKLLNSAGAMILAPGQLRGIYRLRKHRGIYDALCQDGGTVRVYRDGNRDRIYDLKPSTIHSGYFGANIHAPENPDDGISRDIYDRIGPASAGCQVTQSVRDFLRLREEWYRARENWGERFTYTLIEDSDLSESVPATGPAPTIDVETPRDHAAGLAIVNLEARRNEDGSLKVYRLPANDGGGTWEVAGINDRYHPEALADLRAMAPARREAYAARYIEEYTLKFTRLDEIPLRPGTRFAVLDATFNRGPGGSAWIVQDALRDLGYSLPRDGKWGPMTRGKLAEADRESPSALNHAIRKSREAYEREKVGYRANFWKGLENRWNKALDIAEELNG